MRYAAAIVLVGVLGAGFVLHERKSALERHLGQAATRLAERPVKVHCQGLAGELVDVTPEAGTVAFGRDGRPSDTTNLKRSICNALRRFRADAASERFACVLANASCSRRVYQDVQAVHTLAHEAWHLRGELDEAVTECKALQTTAEAAAILGADARTSDAVALYSLMWFYPHLPSEYRTTNCYDGGPLDLRPAVKAWP